MARSKYGPYRGYYPQKTLIDYLKIQDEYLDIMDIPTEYLHEFAEETGFVLPAEEFYAYDLPKKVQKQFLAWAQDHSVAEHIAEQDPYAAPSYLFVRFIRKLPRGTWLIHFTNEDPFEDFDRGGTLRELAYTTAWKNKPRARCMENLTDLLGTFEYVYSFAVPAFGNKSLGEFSRKYGKNAVLFRTDAATLTYHRGDDENQVIVPVCSEYDVIPIWNFREGINVSFRESAETFKTGENKEFDSVDALITYIEEEERKGAKPMDRVER